MDRAARVVIALLAAAGIRLVAGWLDGVVLALAVRSTDECRVLDSRSRRSGATLPVAP